MDEFLRIVQESDILNCNDENWPEPDRMGRQELEVVLGNDHISFTVSLHDFQILTFLDQQDWNIVRSYTKQRSRWFENILLFSSRSQMFCFIPNCSSFQGLYHL